MSLTLGFELGRSCSITENSSACFSWVQSTVHQVGVDLLVLGLFLEFVVEIGDPSVDGQVSEVVSFGELVEELEFWVIIFCGVCGKVKPEISIQNTCIDHSRGPA